MHFAFTDVDFDFCLLLKKVPQRQRQFAFNGFQVCMFTRTLFLALFLSLLPLVCFEFSFQRVFCFTANTRRMYILYTRIPCHSTNCLPYSTTVHSRGTHLYPSVAVCTVYSILGTFSGKCYVSLANLYFARETGKRQNNITYKSESG